MWSALYNQSKLNVEANIQTERKANEHGLILLNLAKL